jgi:hypothetical protein
MMGAHLKDVMLPGRQHAPDMGAHQPPQRTETSATPAKQQHHCCLGLGAVGVGAVQGCVQKAMALQHLQANGPASVCPVG